ncbi:hypothetical protein [Bradyrhizobium sp. WD16]|uniref:hypothetical protein n=1 Tax=Bradyrhizobium sp. WD16 TaxID=1521768 RepID=UPI0020A5D34D|nr:hypothetical protein [Bradyrhizobium sp. WD16]
MAGTLFSKLHHGDTAMERARRPVNPRIDWTLRRGLRTSRNMTDCRRDRLLICMAFCLDFAGNGFADAVAILPQPVKFPFKIEWIFECKLTAVLHR